jgi:Protein of unknown function (DUF3352)
MTTPTSPATDDAAWPTSESDRAAGGPNRTVIVVLAVVLALVIGGGAFALTRAMSGGGDQPSSALPASTAAYVRVDIDPSVGQKIAAVRFLEGLDAEVTDALRSDDVRKELFEMVAAEEPAFGDIDYDRDIAPWLGDRLGVGVVPVQDGEPTVALSLQVKDQEAADAGLDRLLEAVPAGETPAVDWFFHGDYVVVTEAERVEVLQEEVRAGTLEAEAAFGDDMEALGDPGVLSFWVDNAALADFADEAAELSGDAAGMPFDPSGLSGLMLDQDLQEATGGRVAAAVRFGPDHIEVHGVARDLPATIEGGDSAQLLLDLPEDTAVALGLEHGDQLVAAVWEQLSTQLPDEMADLRAKAETAGWSLPGDIQTMVGQSLALAVGPGSADVESMEDFTTFPVAYRVSTDTEAAEAVLDRALTDLGVGAGDMLARDSADGTLTLGLNQDYVDEVAAGGSLGSLSTFRSAVPGAEEADSILFVNLNRYEQLYLESVEDAQARTSLEAIAAVGMSARWSGDGGEFTLRIVAD